MNPRFRISLLCGLVLAAASVRAGTEVERPPSLTPQEVYQILLGEVALQRGEYGLSARALTEAARQTRNAALARRATEVALFAREFEVGLEAARYWNELEPASTRARQLLAALLVASDRISEAKPALAQLLAQAPAGTGEAFMQLNRMLAGHKDKEETFKLVRELGEPYPALPEAHWALAQAGLATGLASLRISETSLAAVNRALELRPKWDAAIMVKAQILNKTAPREALAFLEQEVAAQPKLRPARALLAQQLVEQKRYKDARTQLLKLAEDDPANLELTIAAARISVQIGEFGEAQRILEAALKRPGADVDRLRMALGQLSEEKKLWTEAAEHFRSVGKGERWWDAQMHLANALAKGGDPRAAEAFLLALRPEDDTQRAQVVQARAQALRDAERFREAYELLSKALDASPDSPELLYDTAMAAERIGDLAALEKHLKRLIELKPDDAHAYNALGYTLVDRTPRVGEGKKLIERALELSPDDPYILDSMGWAHYRAGELERSVMFLRRAFNERPDPEIAAHLGEVLWTQGDKEEAKRVWSSRLKEATENSLLQETMHRFLP